MRGITFIEQYIYRLFFSPTIYLYILNYFVIRHHTRYVLSKQRTTQGAIFSLTAFFLWFVGSFSKTYNYITLKHKFPYDACVERLSPYIIPFTEIFNQILYPSRLFSFSYPCSGETTHISLTSSSHLWLHHAETGVHVLSVFSRIFN